MFDTDVAICGSDGSVKNDHATFAWVLVCTTRPFAEAAGFVRSLKPTSFRAEAYGVLSFLRFALRLCLWLARPAHLLAPVFSDSKSVI